jgi:hypothetical protein
LICLWLQKTYEKRAENRVSHFGRFAPLSTNRKGPPKQASIAIEPISQCSADTIAGMLVPPLQKGVTNSLIAMFLQDGHADLGMMVVARQVCRSDDLQVIIKNAEHGIAIEIDARHVGADRIIIKTSAESKSSVGAGQRQEVLFDG